MIAGDWGTKDKFSTNDILLYKDLISKQQYDVLMLRAGSKSYQQIATELQIKLGTVKSRLSRGGKAINKIRLRNKLEQLENAPTSA